jgi:hypothetical protein
MLTELPGSQSVGSESYFNGIINFSLKTFFNRNARYHRSK